MKISRRFKIPRKAIQDFCIKYGIKKLSIFGSYLRRDFRDDSDIDILVEFYPSVKVGYLSLANMESELSEILGRKADIRTPAELSPYFRKEVSDSAKVQYVAKK